jgi:hypothetical protein
VEGITTTVTATGGDLEMMATSTPTIDTAAVGVGVAGKTSDTLFTWAGTTDDRQQQHRHGRERPGVGARQQGRPQHRRGAGLSDEVAVAESTGPHHRPRPDCLRLQAPFAFGCQQVEHIPDSTCRQPRKSNLVPTDSPPSALPAFS